jgi:hypothetical protein
MKKINALRRQANAETYDYCKDLRVLTADEKQEILKTVKILLQQQMEIKALFKNKLSQKGEFHENKN